MKYIILSLLFLISINTYAQSLYNLENNPTFKGITIGMSIKGSVIASKIKHIKTSGDLHTYEITDRDFYSIFGIQMDSAHLIVKNDHVYAVELIRNGDKAEFKAGGDRLIFIKSQLTKQWGKPFMRKEVVYKNFTRLMYFLWEATTKKAEWYMDYYGAFVGHKLVFRMAEHKIDF